MLDIYYNNGDERFTLITADNDRVKTCPSCHTSSGCSCSGLISGGFFGQDRCNMATSVKPGKKKQKSGLKMPKNLVIDRQKLIYDSEEPIGAGGFGEVFSAIHKDWDLRLAVKKLGVTRVNEGLPITTKLGKEALLLKDLRHPNIIELSGVLWKAPDFGIVMPLVPHGSLDTFIHKYETGCLIKIEFMRQISLGLAYLHTLPNPIVHGDLKLGNVLVDTGCVMKLADFGLSSWREYQRTYSRKHGVQGTITHMAPEMWENSEIKPQEPQDIYALGVLSWELFAEQQMFEGREKDMIIHYVKRGKQPSVDAMGSDVPRELKKLVQSCWSLEVNQRPAVLDIKSSLTEIAAPIEKDIKRAKSQLLAALDESSDEEDPEESEDESAGSAGSEDERQRREQQERKEKDREKAREERKRSKAAATVDKELLQEEPVPEDDGEHSSNPHSEVACSAALKVTEKMHPKFTVKPKDKAVKESDKAEFHATAKGKPIPEITWFKDDELIKSTDRVTITSKEVRGDRTSTLTIHKAEITDSCELRVCAKNTAGEDNCTAKLSVASRFATHGSYQAHDSGTTLHLCKVDANTVQAYADTVSAIRTAAVVWPKDWTPPSVPGVDVLVVYGGWDAMVRRLQDAESRGHKTVAVAGWLVGVAPSIKRLSDPIAAPRDNAATDVWLLCHTSWLSDWQQEMDKDSHYRRIK